MNILMYISPYELMMMMMMTAYPYLPRIPFAAFLDIGTSASVSATATVISDDQYSTEMKPCNHCFLLLMMSLLIFPELSFVVMFNFRTIGNHQIFV